MVRRQADTLLPLELAILEAGVATGEFHGFALAKALQTSTGAQRLTAHGTLYKALGRMEKAGLLTSRWEEPAPVGRPRRRLYTVSGAGERAHAAAVATAPHRHLRPGWAT